MHTKSRLLLAVLAFALLLVPLVGESVCNPSWCDVYCGSGCPVGEEEVSGPGYCLPGASGSDPVCCCQPR